MYECCPQHWHMNSKNEIRHGNRLRRLEEKRQYGKKYSGREKKSPDTVTLAYRLPGSLQTRTTAYIEQTRTTAYRTNKNNCTQNNDLEKKKGRRILQRFNLAETLCWFKSMLMNFYSFALVRVVRGDLSWDINCPIPPAHCMLGLLACSEAYEFGQLGTGLSWFR